MNCHIPYGSIPTRLMEEDNPTLGTVKEQQKQNKQRERWAQKEQVLWYPNGDTWWGRGGLIILALATCRDRDEGTTIQLQRV